MYVFVRQDISLAQQIVQSNHATLSLSSHYGVEGTPNIVVIGVPDVAALERACREMTAAGIPHHSWHEPDFDMGFTAITSAPIEGEQRRALAHYKVWNVDGLLSPSSMAERILLTDLVVGSTPTGRSMRR